MGTSRILRVVLVVAHFISRFCGAVGYHRYSSHNPPTLNDLRSNWVDPNSPVSTNIPETLGGDQRDLPTINNFWGSLGIAPEGARPVDLFAVNSVELPPFAGCGAKKGTASAYGCGMLFLDDEQPLATATQWAAYEALRTSGALNHSGLIVTTSTRMVVEETAVMWVVNVTNPPGNVKTGDQAVTNITFALGAMFEQYATVGTWVYPVPNDLSQFNFSRVTESGRLGVSSTSRSTRGTGTQSKPAVARYTFVGSGRAQPDVVEVPVNPSGDTPPTGCNISGAWIQDAANEEFDVIVFDGDHFNISHSDARKKVDGWTYATGTLSEDGVSFKFAYFRPDTSPGQHGWVADSGYFSSDCDHVVCKDSTWHRKGAPVKPPVVLEAPCNQHGRDIYTSSRVVGGKDTRCRAGTGRKDCKECEHVHRGVGQCSGGLGASLGTGIPTRQWILFRTFTYDNTGIIH
eukprot:m.839802 g.839802  ORF g.839802 m.839802 type:complete len:459 (-) comp23469_c0_seq4:4535-5911(-)